MASWGISYVPKTEVVDRRLLCTVKWPLTAQRGDGALVVASHVVREALADGIFHREGERGVCLADLARGLPRCVTADIALHVSRWLFLLT
jgi:hypothetical protein